MNLALILTCWYLSAAIPGFWWAWHQMDLTVDRIVWIAFVSCFGPVCLLGYILSRVAELLYDHSDKVIIPKRRRPRP